LKQVIFLKGTPTIMIGDVEDPAFEEHLRQGPYVVFDDAARPEYKKDPRVYFVPGHPVLRTAMPELFKGMGVELPGNAVMKAQQLQRRAVHNIEYGSMARKVATVAAPAAVAALAVLGGMVGAGLRSRKRNDDI